MNLKIFTCLTLFVLNSAFAGMEKISDEDVLSQVASKLIQIESHLKNERIYLSNAVFTWNELDQFQKDLMFAVAHDPNGPGRSEIPEELQPGYLSLKLKDSWRKLEESVFVIETLAKTDEWANLKADMEQFFKYREEFFYQPARMMIKNGELTNKLSLLREKAKQLQKSSITNKQFHVRVVDPFVESLAHEMESLNRSVRMLKELRNPPPVEVKTIYKKEHKLELITFGAGALGAGMFLSLMFMLLKRFFRKKPAEKTAETVENGFDYTSWLRSFETHLKNFKSCEDQMVEDHLILKQVGDELREARKKLNQADSQQDFYASLDQLNLAAPKVEEYFAKVNLKKNTEISRKVINTVVQLCDAIESGRPMDTSLESKKVRALRQDRAA